MKTVGICQVKAPLSEIIEKGQEVCITNCGTDKAFIIPASKYRSSEALSVFQRLANMKKTAPLGAAAEIILMKNEGCT